MTFSQALKLMIDMPGLRFTPISTDWSSQDYITVVGLRLLYCRQGQGRELEVHLRGLQELAQINDFREFNRPEIAVAVEQNAARADNWIKQALEGR